MRPVSLVLCAVLLAGPVAAVDLGQPAPLRSLVMADVDGREWSIDKVAAQRGALVLFLCVHCPWVRSWSPRIAELADLAIASDIGVLAVNSNDPQRVPQDGADEMRRQIADFGFRFPYAIDRGSLLARGFAAQRTPEAYLFDATGLLVYHGTIDDDAYDASAVDRHFLREAIAAVAQGETPDPPLTKALGCTLKMYPAPPSVPASEQP